MNTNYDISVIIVNYNGKHYIDALFCALSNQTVDDLSFEIIFVDNNSSDSSVEYIEKNFKDKLKNLKIVKSEENLGFAGGNNLGVKSALGKYIVFLNNDTKPDNDWLITLYKFISDRENVIIANSLLLFYYDFIKLKFYTRDRLSVSNELFINGKRYIIDNKFCKNLLYENNTLICNKNSEIAVPLIDGVCEYDIQFTKLSGNEDDKILMNNKSIDFAVSATVSLSKNEMECSKVTLVQNAGSGIDADYNGYDIGMCEEISPKFEQPYQIQNACGASMITKRDDFIKAGGFDEKFFMYYEDTDLSFKLKKQGGEIWFCPSSVVRHIHTGSSKEWSPFFIYHISKNKLLFIYKNISAKLYIKYLIKQIVEGIRYKQFCKIRGSLASLAILLGK